MMCMEDPMIPGIIHAAPAQDKTQDPTPHTFPIRDPNPELRNLSPKPGTGRKLVDALTIAFSRWTH